MFSSIHTMSINGMAVQEIQAETDLSEGGLPVFEMVGFLGSEVRESRERIRTALKNSGFLLPPRRITVNLSPADVRKSGTSFDLAVAASLLCAMGIIDQKELEDTVIAGELSLSGEVRRVNGILPMARKARDAGYKRFIVPKDNAMEGGAVEGIEVIGLSGLKQMVDYLTGSEKVESTVFSVEERLGNRSDTADDFSSIQGQAAVRRAMEVAVSGMHNIMMIGPPGSGKSMMAKCLPSILPPLSPEECLEISEIYSVSGLLGKDGLKTERPFISPHHTASAVSLSGGGKNARPGQISLAHRGVLFLDELPEFDRQTIEILRQPLEDRKICIARANGTYTFPADFLLATALNPCKCGYYPDRNRCTCSENEVHNYLSRISRPLLDRIDICVEAREVSFAELAHADRMPEPESSESIRGRVEDAVKIQKKRFEGSNLRFNADIRPSDIRKYCAIGVKEEHFMEKAFHKLGLSARAYHRILKCARTIADLDHKDKISTDHIAEAVGYRAIDRRYWGGAE
ncbi:magnesium chelatase family protein [Lachnospiraceae bacterium]|nr:magnesium chelatase family protein [Lachnospiraceae bacterium]